MNWGNFFGGLICFIIILACLGGFDWIEKMIRIWRGE